MKKVKIFVSTDDCEKLEQEINEFLSEISDIDKFRNIKIHYKNFNMDGDKYLVIYSAMVEYTDLTK